MAKAGRSGIKVVAADVPVILAMIARGDRRHDVAAWFGLNQGRIKEVEDGKHGHPSLAPTALLPPSGSPGRKALDLRDAVDRAQKSLAKGSYRDAQNVLIGAIDDYDTNL